MTSDELQVAASDQLLRLIDQATPPPKAAVHRAEKELWRGYFQAALTGLLAATQYQAIAPQAITETAAKIADEAIKADNRR